MKYSPKHIKNSFNTKGDNSSLVSRFIIRPVSFYAASLALEFKMTADQATAISLALGILSISAFMAGARLLFIFGVLLYFLAILFDYVDGNIARVTDSATYFGKFADGAVDVFVDSFIPFGIAVGFYFSGNSIYFLMAGIIASMLLLLGFFMINRASFIYRWAKTDKLEGKLPPTDRLNDANPFKSGITPLYKISYFVIDAKILVLAAAAVKGMTTVLYVLFFTLITARATVLIISAVLDSASRLKIHRISKSDLRLLQK